MDWFEYLNMIYSVANVDIPIHERIIVTEVQYVRNLFSLLDKTPPRIVGIIIITNLKQLDINLCSLIVKSIALKDFGALKSIFAMLHRKV